MGDDTKQIKVNDVVKTAEYVVASQQTDLVIEYLQQLDPETHKTSYYAVKDFYKADKVEQTLKSVIDNRATKAGDYYEILAKLQAKPEALLSYYNAITSDGNLQLKKETYKLPNVEITKELAQKYTEVSKEYETTVNRLPLQHLLMLTQDESKANGETVTVTDYAINDPVALANELAVIEKLPITLYGLEKPKPTLVKSSINGVDVNISDIKYEAERLIKKIGLTESDYKKKQGVFWHLTFSRVLADILAEMRKRGSTTHYPNIRGDEAAIPKEVLDAGLEGYTQTKETPDLLSSLDTVYRNEQERVSDGGVAIQTDLFKGLLSGTDDTDIAPWATVDQAIRTLNIAGTTALIACVRYLHDNPKGGNIDLADLMAYDHKYKEQKESRRGLVKSDRVAFGNSLKLLLALNWGIKTKRSDRTSTIKYYRLINGEIEIDNATGDVLNVKGLKFDNDFYDIKNSLLHVLAPKGIDYLPSPEAKSVALKVQSLFAKHQKDTIAGKPQQVSREWLAKGSYKINARTNELIIKLLDDMAENNLIAKWHNVKGTKTLSGYDKDTYKILLYPTKEAQESYITPEMRKAEREAEKQIQQGRASTLKKVVKSYGNNDLLAQELDTTKSQLELWAGGVEAIPKHIADKIAGL
jgi:hypothetical protein